MTILYEISRYVSSLLDLPLVLDAIVDLLWREFKLDACSIRLLDADGKLRIKSQKGLSKAFVQQATREPTVDCYSGDCFLRGRIVIINDADLIDKPISTNRIVGENINSFARSLVIHFSVFRPLPAHLASKGLMAGFFTPCFSKRPVRFGFPPKRSTLNHRPTPFSPSEYLRRFRCGSAGPLHCNSWYRSCRSPRPAWGSRGFPPPIS